MRRCHAALGVWGRSLTVRADLYRPMCRCRVGGFTQGSTPAGHPAQKGPLTAMQIRLTVLAPRSGHPAGRACDVLVTAPAGTALAAVASSLATAVAGPDVSGAVVLYAGRERLDAQRRTLGEPPLVDGAVLSLHVPGEDDAPTDDVPAQLHVVAGPDAGGVHLLHGGQVRIGRSADADVPLDDPDVSRLHCSVTVADDGQVSVADLHSTNGTTLEGVRVGSRPVPLPAGALLRLGESALRLTSGGRTPTLATAPDGEGHLRVTRGEGAGAGKDAGSDGAGGARTGSGAAGTYGGPRSGQEAASYGSGTPGGRTVHAYTQGGHGAHGGPAVTPRVPDPRTPARTPTPGTATRCTRRCPVPGGPRTTGPTATRRTTGPTTTDHRDTAVRRAPAGRARPCAARSCRTGPVGGAAAA